MSRWLALPLRFVSLWLFMFVAYLILKGGYNLVFRGFIDMRKVAILEHLLLPVGLVIVYWFAFWFEKRRESRSRPS